MDFRELFLMQHARAHAMRTASPDLSVQDNTLRDATEEQIRTRPQPGFNSMAWLFWHMTRAEDIGVNLVVVEQQQVFDSDDWPGKLNVARRDFGAGMTEDEVDAFDRSVNVPAILEYRDAVGRQTQEAIRELDGDALDKLIDDDLIRRVRAEEAVGPNAEWVPDRWNGKQKAFTLTHTVLAHSFLHLGQADINRGILGLPTI